MLVQPVVLSGGSGTRLWPLSREKYPKQLLPLIGEDSLLQATVRRVEGIADLRDESSRDGLRVVIELKRGARNTELCEKTYAMMRQYGGRYCVESFDPRIVAWFRRNAPEVLRGQLAQMG